MAGRNVKEIDKKKLIIDSGGICALTKRSCIDEEVITGQFCHNEGHSKNGPRHNPELKNKDGEENLLFLYGSMNKVIDTHVKKYTVEVLNTIKKNHNKKIRKKQEEVKNNNNSFWDEI